jgi:perosamine synthetase
MIPVTRPDLTEEDAAIVRNEISEGWISSEGPYVEKFEKNFSSYIGMAEGVSVTSGTAALDVILKSIKLNPGSEIIVPSMNISSCLNGILQNGYKPVFVDCNLTDYNSDFSAIVDKVTSKTGAIVLTHIYGLGADASSIRQYCSNQNIILIEDTAQAIGLKINEQNAGTFGDYSTFSFYPNKMITTGEGGMILTNNHEKAVDFRKIRNLCFDENLRFFHDDFSGNYRMTNMQAALGFSQLCRVSNFILHRKKLGETYNKYLKHYNEIQIPLRKNRFSENCYWAYPIIIKDGVLRERVLNKLKKNKIGYRTLFYPLNLQPALTKFKLEIVNDCPNANLLYETGFYLPIGNGISEYEVAQICEIVISVL